MKRKAAHAPYELSDAVRREHVRKVFEMASNYGLDAEEYSSALNPSEVRDLCSDVVAALGEAYRAGMRAASSDPSRTDSKVLLNPQELGVVQNALDTHEASLREAEVWTEDLDHTCTARDKIKRLREDADAPRKRRKKP